ncbi:MAG: secondary thiamine-phosphate synthase enzyme YjbQ, partial [Coriobacteriia bacterium]
MERFSISTQSRDQMLDITQRVEEAVAASGVAQGIAMVFCPHTTAGITINENSDPDVVRDLLEGLARIFPRDAGWRHREGNSDGHLKAALVGSSVTVPIDGASLALGTWQAIYLAEFDGP